MDMTVIVIALVVGVGSSGTAVGEGNMNFTDWLSIYGAVLATAAILWNVYLYFARGPKLALSYSTDMAMAGPLGLGSETYVILTVENRGTDATTIMVVGGVIFGSMWKVFLRRKEKQFVWMLGYPGQSLPHLLSVGGHFRAYAKQTSEMEELSRTKVVYLQVFHGFSNKPSTIRLKPIPLADKSEQQN